jgi:hypothetical protein
MNISIEIYAQVIASIGSEVSAENATATGRSIKTGPDSNGMTMDEYAWLYQTCTEAGTCDTHQSYTSTSFNLGIGN